MSAGDLEALMITNIRGYVEPFTVEFEKGKKLCIVYGENGTGKTTLCDAIELLSSGTMGSLDDKGIGRAKKYWHPATSKIGNRGSVELRAKDAAYSASVDNGVVSWIPPTLKPRVAVLRRPQLLQIVTATAADRYKAIAELVDVAGVEQSEQALANLVKEIERDVQDRTSRVAGAQEILHKLFASTSGGNGDPLEWARRAVQRDTADVLAEAGALNDLRTTYEGLERSRDGYSTARKAFEPVRTEAEQAQNEVTTLEQESSVADAELLDLLQAASSLLAAHPHANACPLCDSTERAADLGVRIQSRLAVMSTLRAARKRQADSAGPLTGVKARLSLVQEDYATERTSFQRFVATCKTIAGITLPDAALPTDIADLAEWLEHTKLQKEAWAQQHDALAARASNAENLREALKTYDENYALAERSSTLHAALKRGLEQMRTTRHAFVNALLAKISEEVGRLYDMVHPGEGLEKISLSLDEKRRSSLDLSTRFQASDGVPPQAYFSDSHLDTLGLCVFLALAKRRSPHTNVLVLDDVLASVDEPHVERLIEMIYTEAQHFRHVVVTTHYRPWREKLRWGWLKQGQCQLVELGRWSDSTGPSLVRSTGEIERLGQLLASPDFDGQTVCAKAGVVLEAVLDFLTELYQCRLPRKPRNDWTLGDLIPAIGKKLRSALRIEVPDSANPTGYKSHALGPMLDELERIAQTRNLVGAHFNKLAFELLDTDAERFARKVLQLAECLVDAEHGWPRSNRSGSYWATAKEARRLHPLHEPG